VLALVLGPRPASAFSHISGKVEIVGKGDVKRKPVLDVLVYVDELEAPVPKAIQNKRVTVLMQNKSFDPHVEAVPVGATVQFPNLDKIMHNAFSVSRGNRFDLGLYKSGAAKKHRFGKPGLVRIYCNIHPQMSAFVLVVKNPYFAQVEPDGTYRIDNVPDGTYTVRAWHEEAQGERRVWVTEQGASDIDFLLDTRRFKRKPHLNKFGKPYKRKRGKY
jgi:plastocyanin